MKQKILFFALLVCFTGSSFARLEWPGKVEEGGYCGSEYPPGFECKEGLACDRRGSADIWGGVCRKPCHDDSDCKRNQRCDKDAYVGFCLEL